VRKKANLGLRSRLVDNPATQPHCNLESESTMDAQKATETHAAAQASSAGAPMAAAADGGAPAAAGAEEGKSAGGKKKGSGKKGTLKSAGAKEARADRKKKERPTENELLAGISKPAIRRIFKNIKCKSRMRLADNAAVPVRASVGKHMSKIMREIVTIIAAKKRQTAYLVDAREAIISVLPNCDIFAL
jgi:histone H3/H4